MRQGVVFPHVQQGRAVDRARVRTIERAELEVL